MLRVALSQLSTHFRRFVAIGLAVMLSVGFLSSALVVGASTQATLLASVGEEYRKADLIMDPGASGPFQQEAVDAVASAPVVEDSYAVRSTSVQFTAGGTAQYGMIRSLASAAMEPSVLASGAYPSAANEAAVDVKTADRFALKEGSFLELNTLDFGQPGEKPRTSTVKITGLLQPSNDPSLAPLFQLVATTSTVTALSDAGAGYSKLQVILKPGQDTAAAKEYLSHRLGAAGASDATVRTAQEKVTATVATMSSSRDQLTTVLLAFAGIALVVSTLVVANTFSVLVAQRTRELALLRCLGAGKAQIRSSVLLEALVVGSVSSVLGVLASVGLMAAVITWARTTPDKAFATLAVPPSAVFAGLVAGTLLTVVAAMIPAKAATAVAPLAALRPADDVTINDKKGRLRLWFGVAALAVGASGLVLGAMAGTVQLAMPAGALSFIGVLLCASLFVPPLVSAAGRLAAPAGVPGKLAAVNAVRNPARTSATAAALLIGVTLVTLMMTGAETSRQAFDSRLAENYPVDVAVDLTIRGSGGEGKTPASATPVDVSGTVEKVRTIDGVEAAVLLRPAGTIPAQTIPGMGSATEALTVYAISSDDASRIMRDTAVRLAPGSVYLPKGSMTGPTTISAQGGTLALESVVLQTRHVEPLVNSEDAAKLPSGAASQGNGVVWLKLKDNLGADQVQSIRTDLAVAFGVPDANVSGAALERGMYNGVIDVLLLVVTGLLGVAVFIALIGVANTLSLSVLERTRENSLLRALGLSKGQLRGMLAIEAVLVAGVAAVMGSALGVAYGWLGAKAALDPVADVVPVVPWLQLLGVFAVAVVAGLLASVLPARRAARLSPVEGLATV
ncbi:ABC transporter permease [Arthrobacter sp. MA-N2]|uniref:ABC transporter permease n=1 Tax=Arthrobacter sp. MA-N2 TaxID=1101188 RepID=UPI0004840A45|nr:FtsX family ABC transporter permease [Arthrobacter sp. MA-N2]